MQWQENIDDLGDPDLAISGLRIWVFGFAYPTATSRIDAGILRAALHCATSASEIWMLPYLERPCLARWKKELLQAHSTLRGRATLVAVDHDMALSVEVKGGGHIEMKVDVDLVDAREKHELVLELDQTYLSPLINSLDRVLRRYEERSQ